MAKRCLESVVIDDVIYPLATLSDFSFISDVESHRTVYVTSSTQQYIDEANTDFIPIIKPYSSSGTEYKKISNLYVSFANFPYTTQDGQRVAIRLVKGESDDFLTSLGFNYNDTQLRLYLSIVIDDELQIGYAVISYYTNDPYSAYSVGYGMYVTGGDSDNGRDIYGIFKGIISPSGGAGSGYIGNALVSNKKMVGYNVPTSSAEGTKTESVNEASASAVSGKPKIGNGCARIKFIREVITD